MAKAEPDVELKKAFAELQGKMHDTNQKLRIADVQVDSLKKQIVHAQLTDKEIESNKEYLERSLQESQNNLREMIKYKQSTS